jgi:hypothetical protein
MMTAFWLLAVKLANLSFPWKFDNLNALFPTVIYSLQTFLAATGALAVLGVVIRRAGLGASTTQTIKIPSVKNIAITLIPIGLIWLIGDIVTHWIALWVLLAVATALVTCGVASEAQVFGQPFSSKRAMQFGVMWLVSVSAGTWTAWRVWYYSWTGPDLLPVSVYSAITFDHGGYAALGAKIAYARAAGAAAGGAVFGVLLSLLFRQVERVIGIRSVLLLGISCGLSCAIAYGLPGTWKSFDLHIHYPLTGMIAGGSALWLVRGVTEAKCSTEAKTPADGTPWQ